MYIQQVELKDLRCFEKCEITFSKNITILAGGNNSGKSTILKSIYKLQDNNSISRGDIRSTKEYGDITIEIVGIVDRDRNIFEKQKQVVPKRGKAFVMFNLYKGSEQSIIISDDSRDGKLTKDNLNTITSLTFPDFPRTDFLGLPKTEDQNNFIYPFFQKEEIIIIIHK